MAASCRTGRKDRAQLNDATLSRGPTVGPCSSLMTTSWSACPSCNCTSPTHSILEGSEEPRRTNNCVRPSKKRPPRRNPSAAGLPRRLR
jgi:hypothetical protein